MQQRQLGGQGLAVGAIGLGTMGMSGWPVTPAEMEAEAIATIHAAIEQGVTLFDTADFYGKDGNNEELLGRALKGRRDKVTISVKFGVSRLPTGGFGNLNASPAYARQALEGSLKRLGTDYIDLYFPTRVDPNVPIEETVGGLVDLVKEGKIRYIGLGEAAAATVRRAHAVHPIAAVEAEYSLWSRDVEAEVLPTLHELNIGFLAYSPLSRGFLSGEIRTPEDFPVQDFRRGLPRFQGENFKRNVELVEHVRQLATAKGCTPAQFALAWVLAQGHNIVPLTGTKRPDRLTENLGALAVTLTTTELQNIAEIIPADAVQGARYNPEGMTLLNG